LLVIDPANTSFRQSTEKVARLHEIPYVPSECDHRSELDELASVIYWFQCRVLQIAVQGAEILNVEFHRRRSEFRHVVRPSTVIKIDIFAEGRKIASGKVFDMSLGGIGIVLDRRSNSFCTRCTVRFKLPTERRLFELPCDVTHRRSNNDSLFWGLSFTDIDDPSREGEHISLWQFLVELHRKSRPLSSLS